MADSMTIAPFSASLTDRVRIATRVVSGSVEPFRIMFTDGQNRHELRFDRDGHHTGTSTDFGETSLLPRPRIVGGSDG